MSSFRGIIIMMIWCTIALISCDGTGSNDSGGDRDENESEEKSGVNDGDQNSEVDSGDYDEETPSDGDTIVDRDNPTDGDDSSDGDESTDGDDPTDGDDSTDGDFILDGDSPSDGDISCEEPLDGDIEINDPGLDWILIPSGTYTMGCVSGDENCEPQENPPHLVSISSFELTQYEITQGQFEEVMGYNPSFPPHVGCMNCPVDSVNWCEAKAFCISAGGRLPTESEWEYAARAQTTTVYSCGDEASCLDSVAWYEENSGASTQPVGQKLDNAFNLYDMAGNVWEWNEDCWHDGFIGAPSSGEAWKDDNCVDGDDDIEDSDIENNENDMTKNHGCTNAIDSTSGCGDCIRRIVRGGFFSSPADSYMRLSARFAIDRGAGYNGIGFRCAKDLDVP